MTNNHLQSINTELSGILVKRYFEQSTSIQTQQSRAVKHADYSLVTENPQNVHFIFPQIFQYTLIKEINPVHRFY